jgi:hypothetical protein
MSATYKPVPYPPKREMTVMEKLDKLVNDHTYWKKWGYFPEDEPPVKERGFKENGEDYKIYYTKEELEEKRKQEHLAIMKKWNEEGGIVIRGGRGNYALVTYTK